MKNKKILLAGMLSILGTSTMAQNSAKSDFEASANIESFCQINAQDINFGIIQSPLTEQSANGQLNVLCSNKTSYAVEMNYGNSINVASSENSTNIFSVTISGVSKNDYKIYINDKPLTNDSYDVVCNAYNGLHIMNQTTFNFYGHTGTYQIGVTNYNDFKSLCNKGSWSMNMTNFQTIAKSAKLSSEFGIMTGSLKKDLLAYVITTPYDSTKIWSKGINNYQSTGTGTEQTIPVNSKIVVNKSSSKYLSEDMYTDTVTASIVY